jgi:FtsP/CotA-like multicopper oxidase with cupredoxin domain
MTEGRQRFVRGVLALGVAFGLVLGSSVPYAGAGETKHRQDKAPSASPTLKEDPSNAKDPAEDKRGKSLRGHVEAKRDKEVVVRTDDGRRVTVNLTQVEQNIVNQIEVNQELTITGDLTNGQMIAQSVDISGVSAGGQVGVGQAGGAQTPATDPGKTGQDGAASPPTAAQPSSVDDCKDDGWRQFGDPSFKNQGECVSWVNRQDRDQRKQDRRQ